MGTRSLTVFHQWGTTPADIETSVAPCLYRQMDGYPSGHGADLAEYLGDFTVVNGLTRDQRDAKGIANGADCLAAQVVAHFKRSPGDFYLQAWSPDQHDHGQEYEYHLFATEGQPVRMVVRAGYNPCDRVIFDGPVDGFDGDTVEAEYPGAAIDT